MLPKPKENFKEEDVSLLEKENTAWTIIYASIAANQDIKLSNAKPHRINDEEPNFAK
jgi:hypothetical protein